MSDSSDDAMFGESSGEEIDKEEKEVSKKKKCC